MVAELAWFRSYLGEHYQSVKYDSVLSDPLPVFMNDSILETSDTCFDMCCVADINRSLTQTQPLYNWIDANSMVSNADKTECMLLGTRQKLMCKCKFFCMQQQLCVYGIIPVKTYKLLGLQQT